MLIFMQKLVYLNYKNISIIPFFPTLIIPLIFSEIEIR